MTLTNESEPIFIVGMNGSGTTMLLDCLNNHPELYGFYRETKLIPYYIKNIERFGDLSNNKNFKKLIDEFRNLSIFRYTNNGVAPPIPDNWEKLPRNLGSVVDSIFKYYAAKEGKNRWCEKTPMHAQHITNLSKLFPGAKFIHLIRDGRSCAASFYRRFGYTPELTIYRWKNVIREARRQGESIGERYTEIRYENLTENPENEMLKICRFLDVKYYKELLTVTRKRWHTGSSAEKIEKNKTKWKDILSENQIKKINMIGGQLLTDLGYMNAYPNSDYNPNRIKIKFWLYRDYIKRAIHEIKRPKNNKWDDFSAIISRAIKQRMVSKY